MSGGGHVWAGVLQVERVTCKFVTLSIHCHTQSCSYLSTPFRHFERHYSLLPPPLVPPHYHCRWNTTIHLSPPSSPFERHRSLTISTPSETQRDDGDGAIANVRHDPRQGGSQTLTSNRPPIPLTFADRTSRWSDVSVACSKTLDGSLDIIFLL